MRAAIAVACLAAGCNGASSDPGYAAQLQVTGAQFRPGAFPPASGGPDSLALLTTHPNLLVGELREKLHGVIGGTARGAIVGVIGDDGTWIITAGPPAFDTPGDGTIDATFGLGSGADPGPFTLEMAAVDSAGRIGAPATVQLVADDVAPPTGSLVVGLSWDTAADLDLHVVDPSGSEAWAGNPNTIGPPKPGEPNDPSAYADGGILDHDGNAGCRRDGHPDEHVIWKAMPEAGTYTVRVDARSLCGAVIAPWYVEVFDGNGALLAAVRGTSTPDDVTYQPHGAGAGQTALTFTR